MILNRRTLLKGTSLAFAAPHVAKAQLFSSPVITATKRLGTMGDSRNQIPINANAGGTQLNANQGGIAYWARWLNPRFQHAQWNDTANSPNFWRGASFAVGGTDPRQWPAQLTSMLASYTPDAIHCTGPTNAISASLAIATIQTNMQAVWDAAILSNGIPFIQSLTEPRSTDTVTYPSTAIPYGDQRRFDGQTVNDWIKSMAAGGRYSGKLTALDIGPVIGDLSPPAGQFPGSLPGMVADDPHFGNPAGPLMGAALNLALDGLGWSGLAINPNSLTSDNWHSNPGFKGSGGGISGAGVSGTVTTGFNVIRGGSSPSGSSVTVACSLVADPDESGAQKQRLVCTPSGAAVYESFVFRPAAIYINIPSWVPVGAYCVMQHQLDFSAADCWRGFQSQVTQNNSGGTTLFTSNGPNPLNVATGGVLPTRPISIYAISEPFPIVAGAVKVAPVITIYIAGTGTIVGTLDIRKPVLRMLPSPHIPFPG
jgi:hypothetical protein